jgi:hypothetical protein
MPISILEQVGRNSKLHFINFNGTAGVEKAMYSGCGNWESDTLTEDLDLSYRAQLKTGNSNILKMWLPLLNYQPLSVLRDPNSLDGIKEELKTSVKMPLAYSNQSLLD